MYEIAGIIRAKLETKIAQLSDENARLQIDLEQAQRDSARRLSDHNSQQRIAIQMQCERDEARRYGEQLFKCVTAEGDSPLPPPWLKREATREMR